MHFVSDPQGLSFPEAVQDEWGQCGGNRYFETDLVRVYGDDTISDQVKKDTAAAIHHYWGRVAGAFGLSEDEYRNRYRHILIDHFSREAAPDDAVNMDWRGELQRELAPLTSAELEARFREKEIEFGMAPGDLGAFVTEQGITHTLNFEPVRIGVCIDQAMPSGSGTGKYWGITVGPNARGDIIHHELVHYAQVRLFGGEAFVHGPRWFTEGQATYMAGQSIAGRGSFKNESPVRIEHCDTKVEGGIGCARVEEPYSHYALAYKYLTAGTPMADIRAFMESAYNTGDTTEFRRFKDEFANYFRNHKGEPLSYEDYQSNYHLLLEDYFR